MTKYAYMMNTGSLRNFFNKIPLVGLPEKVTTRYLYTLGFKSTNDRKIIPLLKSIKFLDDSGSPTDYYKRYRDTSKSSIVLGNALKEVYSDLFKIFPDADKQNRDTLRNFFRTNTGLGDVAVNAITDTFRALCSISNLNSAIPENSDLTEENDCDLDEGKIHNHVINIALNGGRKVKIVMPFDITQEEAEKIKNIISAYL
jgi:hypothetical protein